MIRRNFSFAMAGLATLVLAAPNSSVALAHENGVVKTRSAYSMQETIDRITKDVEAKGIKLFGVIDQAKLAKDAGVDIKPSTLIVFGNPPLGTQFLSAKPESGLDWPVRLLVFEDDKGQVWTAYTDFKWIAKRHGIKNRGPQFMKASEVIASITSSVTAR